MTSYEYRAADVARGERTFTLVCEQGRRPLPFFPEHELDWQQFEGQDATQIWASGAPYLNIDVGGSPSRVRVPRWVAELYRFAPPGTEEAVLRAAWEDPELRAAFASVIDLARPGHIRLAFGEFLQGALPQLSARAWRREDRSGA